MWVLALKSSLLINLPGALLQTECISGLCLGGPFFI